MKNIKDNARLTMTLSLCVILLFLTTSLFSQTVIFDDFTYSSADDPAITSFNKWSIVNGIDGPPSGANYLKSNITFTSDGLMQLRCSNAGTPASATHSRIESQEVNYFEGTYAARVFFDDTPRNTQDPVIQTFYAISPSSGGQNPATYSEVDFEYLPWDAWSGIYPPGNFNNAMWMSSYESAKELPTGLDNDHVLLKQTLGGQWHTLVFRFTDHVHVEFFIDGQLRGTLSNRASDGVSVYPDYNMVVSFANWAYPPIENTTFGNSTVTRSGTMKVDWFAHVTSQSKTSAEMETIVANFRARGVQRKNRAGTEYITTPPPAGVVTVYKDCNYGGYAVGLATGSYTLSQLQAKGVADNDVSSLKVQSGYQIKLYNNADFTGTSVVKAADDNCLVDDSFNDVTGSIVVSQVSSSFSLKIEAENYNNMQGVQTEATTDTGGGLNVGYIDATDWMVYNSIAIPTSGAYTVEYRVASLNGGGQLNLNLNGGVTDLGTITVPKTNGWQTWSTVTQTVNLTAGTYNVGIYAPTCGWNLNWWRITKVSGARQETSKVEGIDSIEAYPNPVENLLYIKGGQSMKGGTIRIVNSSGMEVITSKIDGEAIDVSALQSGLYILRLAKDRQMITKKFYKK